MKRLLLMLVILVLGTTAAQAADSPPDGFRTPAQQDEDWQRIEPGGDSICSDGSPYVFWVHPGDSNKLAIFFQGGGACWNDTTCTSPIPTYQPSLPYDSPSYPETGGIFNLEHPDNPLRDYTIVTVPYCTGDVHFGDNVQEYLNNTGEPQTVYHRGWANTNAVLDWTYENYPSPAQVFLTGCSAGAVGVTMNAPHIIEHYADADIRHLADSYAGITPSEAEFATWNWLQNLPPVAAALVDHFFIGDYLAWMADQYPEIEFAQINTAFDETQVFFYAALANEDWSAGPLTLARLSGDLEEVAPVLSEQLLAQVDRLNAGQPNFYSYTGGGSLHCISNRDALYVYEVDGVRLLDWYRAYLNGESVEDVDCSDCTLGFPWEEED